MTPDRPNPRGRTSPEDKLADGRLTAPSAARNMAPITDALAPILRGRTGVVLEIGSGSGEHAVHWAGVFPDLVWQPSDPFDESVGSIAAWAAHAGHPNLRAPLHLDATRPWPDLGPLAAVISLNVIHIAPWPVAMAIADGAGCAVDEGGVLIFYGPFRENGQHTGEGNIAFDASLRARDPDWGIRDLEAVAEQARRAGFCDMTVTAMPANNRLVVFSR